MYYIFQNGNDFGFKCDDIHEIIETDVLIGDEIYQQFFEVQSNGISLRVKDINGTTFEEIFEAYVPVVAETNMEKLIRLKNRLLETDHMIVECYECNLLGLEIPYDIAALHEERKEIKTEIESLQSE
jgi:hypothetical protein